MAKRCAPETLVRKVRDETKDRQTEAGRDRQTETEANRDRQRLIHSDMAGRVAEWSRRRRIRIEISRFSWVGIPPV